MPKRRGRMKITVFKDGPYLVTGSVPIRMQTLVSDEGGLSSGWQESMPFETKDEVFLCRCGDSKSKPYCDGSHLKAKFDGTETASRRPNARQAEVVDGSAMTLSCAEDQCAFARFCDPGGKVWGLMDRTDDPRVREEVVALAGSCPSGRLALHVKDSGREVEPKLEPSIGVVEDPPLGCSGPLWVRGAILIESSDGTPYELRNRVALCRCGESSNKPFCTGRHAGVNFRDGLVEFAKPK